MCQGERTPTAREWRHRLAAVGLGLGSVVIVSATVRRLTRPNASPSPAARWPASADVISLVAVPGSVAAESVRHGPFAYRGGRAVGFSHDALGAALAATNLLPRVSGPAETRVVEPTLRQQCYPATDHGVALPVGPAVTQADPLAVDRATSARGGQARAAGPDLGSAGPGCRVSPARGAEGVPVEALYFRVLAGDPAGHGEVVVSILAQVRAHVDAPHRAGRSLRMFQRTDVTLRWASSGTLDPSSASGGSTHPPRPGCRPAGSASDRSGSSGRDGGAPGWDWADGDWRMRVPVPAPTWQTNAASYTLLGRCPS